MKLLPLALACILNSLASAGADTIALWTFEAPNIPPTLMGNTISGLLPALGSGDCSGYHANGSNVWSSQVGNGSASALAAYYWSVGDYTQFHTSSAGYNHLQLTWDQAAAPSSFGPTNFSLLYSTDGQNFTVALSHYQVYRNSATPPSGGGGGGLWNPTTPNPNYSYSLDLSGITDLQGKPNVYFRLEPTMGGSDYVRIDNFSVTGLAVPEPGGLLGLGLTALVVGLARRTGAR